MELKLCPHCQRPMKQMGKYGLECPACSLAMQTGGDIPPPNLEMDTPSEEAGAERTAHDGVTTVFKIGGTF